MIASDFSPRVLRQVDGMELDRTDFFELLASVAAENRGDGVTMLGEFLNENYVPLSLELPEAEINSLALVSFAMSEEFRDAFALHWLSDISERMVRVERDDMVDDSERDEPECHRYYSPDMPSHL